MSEIRMSRNNMKRQNIQTQDQEPLNIQLDISTLNVMCRFVLSDSTYVRRYDLAQLRRFMRLINKSMMAMYSEEIKERLLFIKFALEARLDNRLTNQDAIIGYINTKFPKDINFITKEDTIGREDINWVNQIVSETLKYSFIYNDIPDIRNLCNEFAQTSIGHRSDVVAKFEAYVDKMKNQFREVRVQDENNTFFSLQGEVFENQVTDTYNAVRSPSRRLITGMVGFNLLTGGLENGRVYMLIGDSGVGKSLTLLNIMYQIKKYNPNYKTKDPTKTPCVVLLTMENTMVESVTRLFSLVNESNRPMDKYNDINEVFRILREQGGLVVDDQSPIDIVIKYKPNHSVSTDYLYDLYDELGDNGFEPICLIQDHVKRIRSIENEKEFRIELGNIVNEFKVFAADKDIPVLTDSHVNRQGSITIEKGAARGINDITRRIGKGDTGESLMMIENLDMGIVINKEWDEEKNMYMVFSSIKMRDTAALNYVVHPFVKGSTIKLVEDINLPQPVFKHTLSPMGEMYMQQQNIPYNMKSTAYNKIENHSDEDYFEDGSSYNEIEYVGKQDIGIANIEEEIDSFIIREDEDMYAKAKRLGKVCPIRLYSENDNSADDIVDGIESIINGGA